MTHNGTITIEFRNWKQFQSESRTVKNPSWFRFENKTYQNGIWDALDHESGQFSAFMFLLMFVSQNGNEHGKVKTNLTTLSRLSGLSATLLEATIDRLVAVEVLVNPDTSGNIRMLPEVSGKVRTTRHNNTIQNNKKDKLPKPKRAALPKPATHPPQPSSAIQSPLRGNPCVARYIDEWAKKYGGGKPPLAGKDYKLLKSLSEIDSPDTACDMISVFFQMPEPWFETKCHDVGTLWENRGKVKAALDTGLANPTQQPKPKFEVQSDE